MAVKLTGSLSLTEINAEWSLGFDLDSYRGTQWFLTPAYSGPRTPRGTFGPDTGSGYTSVAYSDFYGTQSLPPPMTAQAWLVGGGAGAGGKGGGGGGGGIRAANVTLTAGSNYTITVGGGGAGGYRNHPGVGPSQDSTDGGLSAFGNVQVGGGGAGTSGGTATPNNRSDNHGHSWGYQSGNPSPKYAAAPLTVANPLGGGGGGACEHNDYRIGGLRGGYGQNGGNNIGFGPSAQPYAMGGGGGGGPQAQRGWNGWKQGLGYNQNYDHYGPRGTSGRGNTSYNTHVPAPTMNPASPGNLNRAGPGGRGSYSWSPLNMGWHGGGGGGGSNSGFTPHWGHAGSGGSGGGASGASNPQTGGNWKKNGNNGGTNTGGGAGGGGSSNSSPYNALHRGGNGGSGVVYLRYSEPAIGHGGPDSAHCVFTSGGYFIHKWTSGGFYSHSAGDNPRIC